ncbi:hypothetical protein [Pseudomonas sp. R5(2019)]|uniref:hypothetical protein n=1 Tax=Pseudomonas sp. R5(2019) TaxID=2697566 RepID=UPI001412986B|nr:hypothetical protein [Pseudomonas sp. R5(2019)]NBA96527.1 hypothetical protein [Pseudomonas sp. R5(2019)]
MRSAISGLFIASVLLASPVFAADDNCDAKLQTLKDGISQNPRVGEAKTDDLKAHQMAAKAARAKGDTATCVTESEKGIRILLDQQKSKG